MNTNNIILLASLVGLVLIDSRLLRVILALVVAWQIGVIR